jgi:hypothetical protein
MPMSYHHFVGKLLRELFKKILTTLISALALHVVADAKLNVVHRSTYLSTISWRVSPESTHENIVLTMVSHRPQLI